MAETSKAAPAKATAARKSATVKTPDYPGSITEALAILQTRLPKVSKGETAEIKDKDTGRVKYTYRYADLGAVSEVLLPLLGELGMSFISRPTLVTVDGSTQFVLEYELKHVTGDFEGGTYPLPAKGSPQDMGSAITYARRYCLCAVTGLAPEKDDDDAARVSASADLVHTDSQAYAEIAAGVAVAPSVDTLREWRDSLVALGRDGRVTDSDAWAMQERMKARKAWLDEAESAMGRTETQDGPSAGGSTPQSAESGGGGTQVPPTPVKDESKGSPEGLHVQSYPPDDSARVQDAALPEEAIQNLTDAGLDPRPVEPTGDPARMDLLERFLKQAKTTDALKSQFGMVSEGWDEYTPAEQKRMPALFDREYKRITGKKRPAKPDDWE